jgi:hypothetical protein
VSAAVTSQVLVPHAPSQGHGQARPESHPAGDREAAGDVADDDAPPGWGQLGSQPAPAPERTPEVLVMREGGCVMSQCPTHEAEASTSHASPPASDVAVAHPEQELHRAGAPPTHFDEARASRCCGRSFGTTAS